MIRKVLKFMSAIACHYNFKTKGNLRECKKGKFELISKQAKQYFILH